MTKDLRKGRILAVLGIFLLVIAWQITPALGETPKRGGALTIVTDRSAVGLDPHLSMSGATLVFSEQVYDTLLRFDDKLQIVPCLATSWEQPDSRTYIFRLRKGVKFHNGREMTSEDVKFTFDRILDPNTGAYGRSTFKNVDRVEALDKYTVKITLKNTMAGFLSYVAYGKYSAILPKDELVKRGNLQKVMIGTGPFKLKEYRHGVGATFVRNEDYWEPGLPYLDGLKIVVVKDEASRLAGMRRGTYDVGWVKGVQTGTQAAKDPNINLITSAPAKLGQIFLNHKTFPFNNMKLRQAVSACIDRQMIIEKVLLGKGKLASVVPASAVPYALSQEEMANLPFYKQDFDLAKKLLKEAGYPDGFEFTIKTSSASPDYIPGTQMVVAWLAKVGIKANIQIMEWGAYVKMLRNLDYQAANSGSSWRPDPTGYFDRIFHSKSKGNTSGLVDPEIDRLIDLCATETNLEKRIGHFSELQHKAAEKVIALYLYSLISRYEMVNKRVKNYLFMANDARQYLRQAWVAE